MAFSYRTHRRNAGGQLATTAVILLSVVFNNQFYVMGDDYQQQLQQPIGIPRPNEYQGQVLSNQYVTENQELPKRPTNQVLPTNQQQPTQFPTPQYYMNNQPYGQQKPLSNLNEEFVQKESQPLYNTNQQFIPNQQQPISNNIPSSIMPDQQEPLRSDYMKKVQQVPPQVGQMNDNVKLPLATMNGQQPVPESVNTASASSYNNGIGLGEQQSLTQFQQPQQQRPQNLNQPMMTSNTTTGSLQQPLPNSSQQFLPSNQQQLLNEYGRLSSTNMSNQLPNGYNNLPMGSQQQQQPLPNSSQQLLSSNQQQLPNEYGRLSSTNMSNQLPNGYNNLPMGVQQQQQPLPLSSAAQQWKQQPQTGFIDNLSKIPNGVGDQQNVMQQQPMPQKFQNQFDQGNRQQLEPNKSQLPQQLSSAMYQGGNLNDIHRFSQMGADQSPDANVDGQLQTGNLNGHFNNNNSNNNINNKPQEAKNKGSYFQKLCPVRTGRLNGGNGNTGISGLMGLVQQPINTMQQGGEQVMKIPVNMGQNMGSTILNGARDLLGFKRNVVNKLFTPLTFLPKMTDSFFEFEQNALDKLANTMKPQSSLNSQPSMSSNMPDNSYSQFGQIADPNKFMYSQQNTGQQPYAQQMYGNQLYPQPISGVQSYPQQMSPGQYNSQQLPPNLQPGNESFTQLRKENPINAPQFRRFYSHN